MGKEDEEFRAIVQGDIKDIDNSDVLLVNATKPSWGTAMEVYYAHQQGKRVFAFVGDRISPWLRYHSTMLHDSLKSAIYTINLLQK